MRKKSIKLILLLIALLFLFINIPDNLVIADDVLPQDELETDFSILAQETTGDLNSINATNAILVEADSMRILYEKNAYDKRPNASTTKILTAMVAIELGNPNDVVTVSKRAAAIGGSSINLRQNEKLTLEELLYGLMLKSGNDAAVAIAEHIGGTVEEFMKIMNAKAKEIGAKDTHFTSPHGLDNPEHYSTAYDLALITSYCLKNDYFRKIVSTTETYISNRALRNTNDLLFTYEGTTGVKTGFTNGANRCLVASAKRDGMEVIAVVLGCENKTKRFNDSKLLMNYAFKNYKKIKLCESGEYLKNIDIDKGLAKRINAVASKTIELPLTEEEEKNLEWKYVYTDRLEAPVEKGHIIGNLYFVYKDETLAEVDLLLEESVEKKGLLDFLLDIFQQWCEVL